MKLRNRDTDDFLKAHNNCQFITSQLCWTLSMHLYPPKFRAFALRTSAGNYPQ